MVDVFKYLRKGCVAVGVVYKGVVVVFSPLWQATLDGMLFVVCVGCYSEESLCLSHPTCHPSSTTG